jgi:D-alanyl-D-alanine carboxypeptidase/D-alanyl-D-alanine-endopeptidase (penicillin-binding protein 4)
VIRARVPLLFVVLLLSAPGAVGCGASKSVITANPPPGVVSARDSLRRDLDLIFNAPAFERTFWSVLVRPADSTEDLYSLNPGKLAMPGSAMKIVTTAAVAEHLGWDHQFETRVVAIAPIESGILRGDLVVIGGGDPGISERADQPGAMRALAHQVREAGITNIEGGVIGNDDLFDEKELGDGWTLDNLPYGYSAPVSALMYNEGSVDLVIRAGAAPGEPVTIQVRPDGSGLEVHNRLTTVSPTAPGSLTLHRLPGSSRVTVQGQIPAQSSSFVRTASVDNPTVFFARAFRQALIAEGVQVGGDAIDIDDFASKPDLAGARPVAIRRSLPLADLTRSMMKVSQNQHAEILLKSIGGRRTVHDILKSWDVSADSYIIADGSGLSRYNYIASDTLVRILQRMHTDPKHASRFSDALLLAGRDGALANRLTGTVAEGKVRAKTGTVDNVRAIAGYVQAEDGQTLAFSIVANNVNVPNAEIDAAADRALIRLAAYTGGPSRATTRSPIGAGGARAAPLARAVMSSHRP